MAAVGVAAGIESDTSTRANTLSETEGLSFVDNLELALRGDLPVKSTPTSWITMDGLVNSADAKHKTACH